MQSKQKIIILGAGLSGLTAADQILTQLPQSQVIVLEAMDRVGGRTYTIDIEGTKFDLGGQWVGQTQQHTKQLANRSKNQLVPQYHSGKKILHFGEKVSTYKTNIPLDVGIIPLIHMQYNLWKIDRMANKLSPTEPNKCKESIYWDTLTVHTWVQQNIWFQKVKLLIQCAIRAVFGVETNQISFLFFLLYVKQSGGIENLINIENGLQQKKMKYGSQFLSEFLRQQIHKKGGKVILNSFVQSIKNNDKQCQIITRDGTKYNCDYLVMAMPPACVKKIQFIPQLSRERRLICDRNFMGSISKVLILYDQPYWRENGFSGQTLSDCYHSPIFNAYDDTKSNEKGQIQPGLLVFLNAAVDREWSSNRQLAEKAILSDLVEYFQNDKLLNPKSIHWKVWSQEQSLGGGPIAAYPPGVLSQIKDIRKPQGRIHWAGTELATVSQGFMDGAIQSGKRVSRQIIDRTQNKVEKVENKQISYWYSKPIKATKKYIDWF